MDIYLKGLGREIKRTVQVNDNLSLELFCQYVIICMNGDCKHLFQLIIDDEYAYLGPGCYINETDCEEMMDDLELQDLDLQEGTKLMVNYDFRSNWEFIIKIKNIKLGYFEKEFEVITGTGCGIVENIYGIHILKDMIKEKRENPVIYERVYREYLDYDINNFEIKVINKKIDNFLEQYYEYSKPKNYIMNVSLEGFGKEIKRKIAVDSNVNLDDFCRCVIYSMRGDLSHLYNIKLGKEYIDDDIINAEDLSYLELEEKQKLKIIYDFGDNWVFNITVSKIIDGYGKKRFEVLSGKGYGIIDDCGGPWGLQRIFAGKDKSWGQYDIDNFDLKEINRIIELY